VALDKKWGAPSVIDDGVTIAKDIELSDPFENMGRPNWSRKPPARPMMPAVTVPHFHRSSACHHHPGF